MGRRRLSLPGTAAKQNRCRPDAKGKACTDKATHGTGRQPGRRLTASTREAIATGLSLDRIPPSSSMSIGHCSIATCGRRVVDVIHPLRCSRRLMGCLDARLFHRVDSFRFRSICAFLPCVAGRSSASAAPSALCPLALMQLCANPRRLCLTVQANRPSVGFGYSYRPGTPLNWDPLRVAPCVWPTVLATAGVELGCDPFRECRHRQSLRRRGHHNACPIRFNL